MTTGEKLLQLRKKKGISQEKLAEMLGVTRQTVSKWELDEILPDIENSVKIADMFEVSLNYIFTDEFCKPKESKTSFVNKYDSLDFLACMGAAGVSASVMIYWIIRLIRTIWYYLEIRYFSAWERIYIERPEFLDLFNNTIDEIAVIIVLIIVIKSSLKIANKLNKKSK